MPLIPILARRLTASPAPEAKPFRLALAPPPRGRWAGLAGSIALHALLVLFALGALRHPVLQAPPEPTAAAPTPPRVELVPLTPPGPEPEPAPEPEPEPEREERPQLIPQPVATPPPAPIDVEDFPDVVDEVASRGEDGEEGSTDTPEAAPADAPATESARAPTMEEEARRIFGSPRRRGAGSAEREEWTGPLPGPANAVETCRMPPLPPAKPGEPEPTSTAIGRILADDNRTPLSGAHLQVVGHPYSTFSGPGGEYRLTIPRKLVEDCRVQYVRVSATGYRSRLLPLTLALGPRNEDVTLRRR